MPADRSPGPLVSVAWLLEHLGDDRLHVLHVAPNRRVFNRRHLPGAPFVDLHRALALRGQASETGTVEREWLVPGREDVESLLRRLGVGEGDRIVLYDDVGKSRQAIRGYWLLRLYRFPAALVHVLDGGLTAWVAAGGPVTATEPPLGALDRSFRPVVLGERDDAMIATTDQVRAWSTEARTPRGPTRLLDVRTAGEYVGTDVRARRGGHIPGARLRYFEDFLAEDGTIRPVPEILALVRASGAEPDELRATYCQGGVRAALGWFVLHELAGLDEVRNYAGSWEDWGNRTDTPVDTT